MMRRLVPSLALSLLVIIVFGCNLLAAPDSGTSMPPTPEQPASPEPKSPTATQGAVIPQTIPHLTAGVQITIKYIMMFNEQIGWAIGGEDERQDHILTTMDGGEVWSDVTPPEPIPEGEDGASLATGFFLDSEHAWVTYYPGSFMVPDPSVVWKTEDGGQSWAAILPTCVDIACGGQGPLALEFSDRDHGWLMLKLDAAMSHVYVALYGTSDGGLSWDLLIDPTSPSSGNLHTCCQTGMDFADQHTGLVTFSRGPNERVLIDWTNDGGATWQSQQLASPVSDPAQLEFNGLNCGTHSPQLLSPMEAYVALECFLEEQETDGSGTFLYHTADAGQTWSTSEFPGGQMLFLDSDLGWALDHEIYQTTDGGATWSFLGSGDWTGQVSFGSERKGWAAARLGHEDALLRTENSGRNWVHLRPRIGP